MPMYKIHLKSPIQLAAGVGHSVSNVQSLIFLEAKAWS